MSTSRKTPLHGISKLVTKSVK